MPGMRDDTQADIALLARVHAVACIEKLVKILNGPDAASAVLAARELPNRACNRPLQPLAFDTNGIPVEVHTSGENEECETGQANGQGIDFTWRTE
jgi:hypothetical protein